MRVILDHREKKIVTLVTDVFPCVEIGVLPLGDVLIIKDDYVVVLERKSVPDLVSSIRSNHLWEQLLALLKAKTVFGYVIRRKVLVIHGDIESYAFGGSRVFWSSLAGAFQEILFVYGVPIVFVGNDDFFSQFLRIFIQRETEGANDGAPKHRWHHKRVTHNMPVKVAKMVLLDALPGVGEVLSSHLVNTFGTLEGIATASLEDLQTVEGIGTMEAKKIYDLFHK
jgi:DNA excision repair protein ERCC-4